MRQIQGFLPNFAPMQLEGFGSTLQNEEIITIVHQGSLTSTDYFPSLIIRTSLKDGSWSSLALDTTVGFPKSTAIFDERNNLVFFVDHDKENDQTKLPDGNWRGAYLNSVELKTGKSQDLSINSQRRFWHDLKEVDGKLIGLAFSKDFTIYVHNSNSSLLLPNVGSFAVVGNELAVSPYGGGNKLLSFVDSKTLVVNRQLELSGESFIHETVSLDSLDGVKRILLLQEDASPSPNFIIQDEHVGILKNFPNPRSIFPVDLNGDGVDDIVMGTNEGSRFFLNDGYGRLLESRIPELDGHFNVHPAGQYLVSFDWPTASPRMNIQEVSKLSKFLTLKDATLLGLKPDTFSIVPAKSGLLIIQDSLASLYEWNGFSGDSIYAKKSIRLQEDFVPLSERQLTALGNNSSKVFLATYDESLSNSQLPKHIIRVQSLDSFRALDVDGNAGKAYRVYKAAFNRDPMKGDKEGLGFWITQIDKGMDLIEVSARFVDSNEFRSLYGTNPTNEQFLTKLYTNVLGRQPEASGYNWWLNQLNTNPEKTKAKVLADFAESAENQTGVLGLIGSGITYEPWVG